MTSTLARPVATLACAWLTACGGHGSDERATRSQAEPRHAATPAPGSPPTASTPPSSAAPPAQVDAFTAAFVARARAQHPGADVHATAPLRVAIGDGTPLVLDNLGAECGGVATGCDAAFDRWIRVLFAASAPHSSAVDRASVRAFLVPQSSLAMEHVVARPWVGSLWEVMVIDSPDALTVMRDTDARQLGMDEAALASLAEQNMEHAFSATIGAESTPFSAQAPGVRVLHPTDSYGNARLLLHDRWEPVAAEVHGELVAAAPARDVVVWTGTAEPRDMLALRFLAQQMFEHEPHPIAPTVFRFTADGWAVYDENTEPVMPGAPP